MHSLTVFLESAVENVVEAVFDKPMIAGDVKEKFRSWFDQAGDLGNGLNVSIFPGPL